jgi:hypothetical protein
MMIDKILEPDTLRVRGDGIAVNIRMPWYRGLPLSDVEVNALAFDGEDIATDRIRFEVNGKSFSLDQLPGLTTETWFVIDDATLAVSGVKATKGTEHDIKLILSVYPPYLKGIRRAFTWTRRMEAK